MFPNFHVTHLETLKSEQCPIQIILNSNRFTHGRRRRDFKFEAIWLKDSGYKKVVMDNWKTGFFLDEKMQECNTALQSWKASSIGEIKIKLTAMMGKIFESKKGPRCKQSNHEIQSLTADYEDLRNNEEMMWRQRAKAHWVREGDKNTKFSHAKTSNRCRKNTITCKIGI